MVITLNKMLKCRNLKGKKERKSILRGRVIKINFYFALVLIEVLYTEGKMNKHHSENQVTLSIRAHKDKTIYP
jgi:hypothetical protein